MGDETENVDNSRTIVLSDEGIAQAANQEEIVRITTENASLRQRVYVLRALVNQLQEEKLVADVDFDRILAQMPKEETGANGA